MSNYPNLLSPKKVGNILFKNRIFTAPTGVHALQNGELSFQESVITHFGNRARGGPAMVTCTGVQINPDMKSDGSHLHINPYTTAGLRSLYEMAARVHHFGAVASMQLSDQFFYDRYYAVSPGLRKMGRDSVEMPRELIEKKARMYAEAAALCKKAGFDMCMVHFGHATDNAQFLSERFNRRTDEFGGCLENRARYLTMTLDAIREKCGKDFLIELRFSASEVDPEGITVEDSIELVKLLEGRVDLLHCSCGMNNARYFTTTHPSGFLPDTPNVQYAAAIKASGTSIPIVTIGAIQNLEQAEAIIAEGKESGVSMVMAREGREIFITGHSEYSPMTLDTEYKRDLGKGLPIQKPYNYYRDDDPEKEPLVTWRGHGNLLFQNWLNYYVYQETPYDIDEIH